MHDTIGAAANEYPQRNTDLPFGKDFIVASDAHPARRETAWGVAARKAVTVSRGERSGGRRRDPKATSLLPVAAAHEGGGLRPSRIGQIRHVVTDVGCSEGPIKTAPHRHTDGRTKGGVRVAKDGARQKGLSCCVRREWT